MIAHAGELAWLTGKNNLHPGKLGVVEEGAHADLLLMDGNPLEGMGVIGASPGWLNACPCADDVKSIALKMIGGRICKSSL